MGYDFFLSYAPEDRDYVEKLRRAFITEDRTVWYDQEQIYVGDDIRRALEKGMKQSKSGIVILSPNFLKYWPENELSTLFALEKKQGVRILPVLLDVDPEDVGELSLLLAGRKPVSATEGISVVAKALCAAIDRSKAPPKLGKRKKVFLSYATQDKDQAVALKSLLAAFGFNDFVDRFSIPSGAVKHAKIRDAIDEADSMFVLWSGYAAENLNIKKEYSYFLETKPDSLCTVLPLDLSPMPPQLDERQQPDFLALVNPILAYRNSLRAKEVPEYQIDRLIRKRLKREGIKSGIDPRLINYIVTGVAYIGLFALIAQVFAAFRVQFATATVFLAAVSAAVAYGFADRNDDAEINESKVKGIGYKEIQSPHSQGDENTKWGRLKFETKPPGLVVLVDGKVSGTNTVRYTDANRDP